ncbi:MAG: amino acid permease [Proteobacteria bacterium]|nr:amino acid permease [Pseudomonadota bacterium]
MDFFRKKPIDENFNFKELAPCLSAFDLTLLGIGAIIGAGIFVLTGVVAATTAGPAIIISYIVAGLACVFAALSYAELVSSIGGCGSAYNYTYAGFGEFLAWIVGWDLLLEYSISVAAVSVGWSGYFNDFLLALNIHMPKYLMPPSSGGYFNLSAFLIIFFLMSLLIYGVKSSARVNNLMVLIKVMVIFLFIIVAIPVFNKANWSPFMPFGWQGVMTGASLIFFAYIGFDAVSTAAEEAINPRFSLAFAIIASLLICTVIYIVVAGLLTGMVSYKTLNNPSPISHVLLNLGYKTVAGLIGVGAIAGLTTVMLVHYYGLSRVFLAMSRDGLLPAYFAKVNKEHKTPVRIIFFTGIIISLLAGFLPIKDLAELVNIGTLFAFMMVCLGVIILRYTKPDLERPFKTPLMPLVPVLGVLSCFYLIIQLPYFTMLRFLIWMCLGLLLYWFYSRHHSLLNT